MAELDYIVETAVYIGCAIAAVTLLAFVFKPVAGTPSPNPFMANSGCGCNKVL